MWKLTWQGHVIRWDDLTLGEVERIERLAGKPWAVISPGVSARDGMAIGHVILSRYLPDCDAKDAAGQLKLRDWTSADDDLPQTFTDGIPDNPKREVDRWLVQMVPPFTPYQVRTQFTLRDLQLMAAARPEEP